MATIFQLLVIAETHLKRARGPEFLHIQARENEIAISQAASLLSIARSLNHIIDHGIGPGTLPMLESDEERME